MLEKFAALLRDYAELTKARITTLIVLTAWCGYFFGAHRMGASAWSLGLSPALFTLWADVEGSRGHRRVGADSRCIPLSRDLCQLPNWAISFPDCTGLSGGLYSAEKSIPHLHLRRRVPRGNAGSARLDGGSKQAGN